MAQRSYSFCSCLLRSSPGAQWLAANLKNALLLNAILAIFNLLPILPLGGGRILVGGSANSRPVRSLPAVTNPTPSAFAVKVPMTFASGRNNLKLYGTVPDAKQLAANRRFPAAKKSALKRANSFL